MGTINMYQTLEKNEIESERNISSYPISLEEVKQWCNISSMNTSKDFFITEKIIPSVINDWETQTRFFIQDSVRKAFLDNRYCHFNRVRMEALNIYDIQQIEYFPSNYQNGDKMSFININENVDFEYEISGSTLKIHYIKNGGESSLMLYPYFQNRLIIWYKAGYKDNNFSTMPNEIKKALLEMCYNKFQDEIGSCKQSKSFYPSAIDKYKVSNDIDSIHYVLRFGAFNSGMNFK